MGIIYLSRNFSFEAGHRLAKGYKGKCKNPHGHSWKCKVTVQCISLNEYDFGIDFGELKKVCKKVEDLFDHKMILHEKDSDNIEFCKSVNYEYYTVTENPTCEILSRIIYGVFKDELKEYYPRVRVDSVTIKETENSTCTYKA